MPAKWTVLFQSANNLRSSRTIQSKIWSNEGKAQHKMSSLKILCILIILQFNNAIILVEKIHVKVGMKINDVIILTQKCTRFIREKKLFFYKEIVWNVNVKLLKIYMESVSENLNGFLLILKHFCLQFIGIFWRGAIFSGWDWYREELWWDNPRNQSIKIVRIAFQSH